MASFMPAACNPWAMDHAIERLFATPKTTALRPCNSEDMCTPSEGKNNRSSTHRGGTATRRYDISDCRFSVLVTQHLRGESCFTAQALRSPRRFPPANLRL